MKQYIIAIIAGIFLAMIFAFAPSGEPTKNVAQGGELLTCANCGREVVETFNGFCDFCYTD